MRLSLQKTRRVVESACLRHLAALSLQAYLDQTKAPLSVRLLRESVAEERVTSPAAGQSPDPPALGDVGLQELRLPLPKHECTVAASEALLPSYATQPTEGGRLAVRCADGFFPLRGPATDEALCDNGQWVLVGGLECSKKCADSPVAHLLPRGAFRFQAEPDALAGSSARAPSDSQQRGTPFAAPQTQGPAAGLFLQDAAVFVTCAPGFAAERGEEGVWMACEDGVWKMQRSAFSCHRTCGAFPSLSETAYKLTGSGNRHGDFREVACAPGFYPQQKRPHRVKCIEGEWQRIPFDCSQALTPEMHQGSSGLQKILKQMFSREGIIGFAIFAIIVMMCALLILLFWAAKGRRRALRNLREREEALQALKLAGVPLVELPEMLRGKLDGGFSSAEKTHCPSHSADEGAGRGQAERCTGDSLAWFGQVDRHCGAAAGAAADTLADPTPRRAVWLSEEALLPAQGLRPSDEAAPLYAPPSLGARLHSREWEFPRTPGFACAAVAGERSARTAHWHSAGCSEVEEAEHSSPDPSLAASADAEIARLHGRLAGGASREELSQRAEQTRSQRG